MVEKAPAGLACEIETRISELSDPATASVRRAREAVSMQIRDWPGGLVINGALKLLEAHRWAAYELVYHHHGASSLLDETLIERFAGELASWGDVDAFCRYSAGPAWRRGQLHDDIIIEWTSSPDRWWRRAALVSTVPLNLRAAGGTGDPDRTIAVCRRSSMTATTRW